MLIDPDGTGAVGDEVFLRFVFRVAKWQWRQCLVWVVPAWAAFFNLVVGKPWVIANVVLILPDRGKHDFDRGAAEHVRMKIMPLG